jgi:hypothetical protein
VSYPGALRSYFTNELEFLSGMRPIPTYRAMDVEGIIAKPEHDPKVKSHFFKNYFDVDPLTYFYENLWIVCVVTW